MCTCAKSVAYTEGKEYTVDRDVKGMFLIGDDGYTDYFADLVSTFKEMEKHGDS